MLDDLTREIETVLPEGEILFISRLDSPVYPIHISYVSGNMLETMNRLNEASPYPLDIVGHWRATPMEYANLQRRVWLECAPRQGGWWTRSDYTDHMMQHYKDFIAATTTHHLETEMA